MTTVAIDFGTSNTVVSILETDTQLPKSLRFPNLSRLFIGASAHGERLEIPVIPSVLFIKSHNQVILGEGVRSQRLGLSQSYPPERLFKKFKRDLAGDYQSPPRHIEGRDYDSISICELFIQSIWREIKKQNIKPNPETPDKIAEDFVYKIVEHFGCANNHCTTTCEKYDVRQHQNLQECLHFTVSIARVLNIQACHR